MDVQEYGNVLIMKDMLRSEAMLEVVARRFRLLGEPIRLKILRELEAGEKNVNEVVAATGASQSNVSKHLQALYDARLLSRRREGNAIYYSIADDSIMKICGIVCSAAEKSLIQQVSGLQSGRRRAR